MIPFDQRVLRLLSSVENLSFKDFSGIGLLFYAPPMQLPVGSLGDESLFAPQLPIATEKSIARVLADISRPTSPWHDGFHLINASTFELTHICQFIAPPVELLEKPEPGSLPIGARQQSAIAASKFRAVFCSALLNGQRNRMIYRSGKLVHLREGE